MFILNGVRNDFNTICARSPGFTIDNPDGINDAGSNQIQQLNDLVGLLEFKNLLEDLSECQDLSFYAVRRISPRMQRAEGSTSVERILSALQEVCRDRECTGLPSEHRRTAVERLDLLYEGSQLREIQISERTLRDLVRLEERQPRDVIGIPRTLPAVNTLISQICNNLRIDADGITIERIMGRRLSEEDFEGIPERRQQIWQALINQGYISRNGEVLARFRGEISANDLCIPDLTDEETSLISQILSEGRGMIEERCLAGVEITAPPVCATEIQADSQPADPDGSEPTPPERRMRFGFLMDAGGGYFYDVMRERRALRLNGESLDRGPGISARAEGELRYQRFRARVSYEMVSSSDDSFSAPRRAADQIVISALGRVHERIDFGGEVEVSWQRTGWVDDDQSFEYVRNQFVDIGALLSIAFAEGRGAANVLAGINILTTEVDGGRVGGYLSVGGIYRGRRRLGVTWDGGYSYAAGVHRGGIFAGMPIDLVTFGPDIRLTLELNAGLLYSSLPQDSLSIYGGATFSLGNISRFIRRWGVF